MGRGARRINRVPQISASRRAFIPSSSRKGYPMGHPKPIDTPNRAGQSFGFASGVGSGQEVGPSSRLKADHLAAIARRKAREAVDPDACYAEFPERWRSWLHRHFRSARHVAQAFGVSERAAQKWWDGVGGVNGGKVAYAVRTQPGAAQFLFAAE